MEQDMFKLRNYLHVHEDFEIDGVRPKDLRELWKEAQLEMLNKIEQSLELDEENIYYFPLTKIQEFKKEIKEG